jgi:hypothetical protein
MRFATLVLFLVTSACAKSSSSGDFKSTFSVWARDSSDVTIDLSHGAGTSTSTISEAGAVVCTCTFTLAGGIMEGTLDISACTGTGCGAYTGAYTYAHSSEDDALGICNTASNDCLDYH